MTEKDFSGDETQLVVFKLDQEEYGISILQVQEIKLISDITRVPYTPDYINGVLNLRGSVVPVIDIKKRLNLPGKNSQNYTEDTRIIFVRVDEITVGVLVDAVSEVAAIKTSEIELPEAIIGEVQGEYVSGVGKSGDRLLILLNVEEIIGIGSELAEN